MTDDDNAPYEVRRVVSAVEEADGSYVILHLEMKGEDASFAFPLDQIGPLIALLAQAGGKAQAVAGAASHQEALESVGTEVFRDERNLDVHFRLAGGLDLPIGMTIENAGALREQLAASLADTVLSGMTRQ
jgi:hypothetical protein